MGMIAERQKCHGDNGHHEKSAKLCAGAVGLNAARMVLSTKSGRSYCPIMPRSQKEKKKAHRNDKAGREGEKH
jgi:hypothetical protein